MIQRNFLMVVVTGFVLTVSACGPYFSRPIIDPLLIDVGTSTPAFIGPVTSATPSPNLILTPTSTGAYFTLTKNSNCHSGPSISYNVVLILLSGETVEVIGRTRENTWWRLLKDASIDCWVADEWGTFVGEAALIPITSSQYATKALTPLAPTKTKVVRVDAATTTALPSPVPVTNTPLPLPTNTQPPLPTEPVVPPTDIPTTIVSPIAPPISVPTTGPLSTDPPPDHG